MTDMIYKVKFTEEAVYEFRDAVEWYESRAEGFGLRFSDEIERTIERIRLNPDLYPLVVKEIRKIQTNRFPFSIFYTIEDNILLILRIFHNKRNPLEWQ